MIDTLFGHPIITVDNLKGDYESIKLGTLDEYVYLIDPLIVKNIIAKIESDDNRPIMELFWEEVQQSSKGL